MAKIELYRNEVCAALVRDNFLFRIYPAQTGVKFQLDKLGQLAEEKTHIDYKNLKNNAKFQKKVYGVFGCIMMKVYSYLVLIEEAVAVGTILGGTVYRVEKLLFLPISKSFSTKPEPQDQPYIDMINLIQQENAVYFSYEIDLTKNLQRTLIEI